VLRRVLRCKGAKQIGTADNSDDAIVAHDRNSLDPVFLEEAGDFRSLGCFGNPDHWGGHDFSSGELRVPEGGKEFRMQRFPLCQQRQPPITPRFAIGVAAPEQVALADHADRNPAVTNNRCGADPVSKKKPRNLRRRGIGRDGNRVLSHKLARLHREILVVR
jgi:hypothetical protein